MWGCEYEIWDMRYEIWDVRARVLWHTDPVRLADIHIYIYVYIYIYRYIQFISMGRRGEARCGEARRGEACVLLFVGQLSSCSSGVLSLCFWVPGNMRLQGLRLLTAPNLAINGTQLSKICKIYKIYKIYKSPNYKIYKNYKIWIMEIIQNIQNYKIWIVYFIRVIK